MNWYFQQMKEAFSDANIESALMTLAFVLVVFALIIFVSLF